MEEYRESFYMETHIRAFPVMANIDVFDKDIADKVRENAIRENINSVYEILATSLDNVFVALSKAYKYYQQHNTLTVTQLNKINSLIPSLKRNNLLKNEGIDNIIQKLENVKKESDIDSKMELVD